MTKDEIRKATTDELCLMLFDLGVLTARPSNANEKRLLNVFMELERRGVIKDGAKCYEETAY